MNEAELTDIKADNVLRPAVSFPEASEGLSVNDGVQLRHADAFSGMPTAMGADMDKLAEVSGAEQAADTVRAAAGNQNGVVLLTYDYPADKSAIASLKLYAEEGSVLTAAILLRSNGAQDVLSAQQIKVYAERGAKVRIYLAQMLDESSVCIGDVGGYCEDDASVELIRMELGAGKLYAGAEMDLAGARSSFESHVGYRAKDKQRMDMTYTARHKGKKTQSLMTASGVLEDGSFKLFRGTIDLQNGCAGAKGTESEDVLMLGDNVVNQTIPLILCGEEDVEGNHGASIGRLDESVLFYLNTRGLSKEQAEQLIARAKLDAICNQIPVAAVRDEVQTFLGGDSDADGEAEAGDACGIGSAECGCKADGKAADAQTGTGSSGAQAAHAGADGADSSAR